MHKALPSINNRKFAVAPMMDWTDCHCRYLMRLISKRALLYTEMVTTYALLHGDPAWHLAYNPEEHPLALQLGGADPTDLGRCAKLGEKWAYDEINLNCGCPSDRVKSGRFGACLMAEPQLVADCLKAMADVTSLPVTIKCRIGIDDQDSFEMFRDFVATVTEGTGCQAVIVHARNAWLQGLSPKENREIPPLRYDYVYRLKQALPHLQVIMNGGIKTLAECQHHLHQVDGVMMGREAYQNPFLLHQVDEQLFGDQTTNITRRQICEQFFDYCKQQMASGVKLHHLSRHLLGLYHNVPGAKKFRRYISENAHRDDASMEVLEQALALVP